MTNSNQVSDSSNDLTPVIVEKKKDVTAVTESLNQILFPVEVISNPAHQAVDLFQGKAYPVTCDSQCQNVVRSLIKGEIREYNYVSDRYKLVKNEDIFGELELLLKSHPKTVNFTREVRNFDNRIFNVRYKFPSFKQDMGTSTADKEAGIIAGFEVRNSYDGSVSFGGSTLLYRLVCSNGMMGFSKDQSFKSKHTDKVKTEIEKMFIVILSSIDAFEDQISKYKILENQVVARSEWQARVKEIAIKAGLPRYHESAVKTVLDEAALYGGSVNDFLIYNALNAEIYNGDNNVKSPEARNKIDQRVTELLLA